MRRTRRTRLRPHPRPCLSGLAALALLTACELDRYPVGAGWPQSAEPQPRKGEPAKTPGGPLMPPTSVVQPPATVPTCRQTGAPMPTSPLLISAFTVADRLSRFVWGTAADAAFLQKVTRLAPATSTDVGNLTREMLDDPRASTGVARFYRRWLALDETPSNGVAPELWQSLLRETDELTTYLTRFGGSFPDLLQVPFSFLDGRLAAHYGLPVMAADFQRVDLDPAQRGGVLTHGSWLTSHPRATQRGAWINDTLYCRGLLAPVEAEPIPQTSTGTTWRDQLQAATSAQPSCFACHSLLDPPGFLYENYDSLGRFRTSDNGQAVFTRSSVSLPGFEGTLEKAAGLARIAAGSCEAQSCFAQRWLLAGAGVDDARARDIDEVADAFRDSRLSLRELIVAVTESPLFLQP